MEDLTGKQLGQFRIVAPLGEGGMASVYKAYQSNMDRYVAIKILPRHYASDPNFIHRFAREAKVIAGLEHPNILPVYDFGAEEGYTYLVMRLVETGTLSGLLQGQPMDLAEVEALITQIADALDYAHAHGVIHRDVKPSNVLIDSLGRCLLTDFGLAKVLLSVSMFTSSGTFLGTPKYASPEQCLGKELDQRSDIYSLGVILYEMATGRPPFDAETPMGIVVKHIHDPLPMPRKINPALPEAVERVILKALAKEPGDRYASAGELAKALKTAIQESDSQVRQELQARTLPGKRLEKKRAFPVWGWVAGGVLALGLVAGLVTLAIRSVARLISHPETMAGLTQTEIALPASLQTEPPVLPSPGVPTLQTEMAPLVTQLQSEAPPAAAPTSTVTPAVMEMPSNLTYQDWQVQTSFPAPVAGASDILVVGDQIWVIADKLYRLNLKGEILDDLELGVSCERATWDGENIWCASDRLYKIDPATGQELSSFDPGASLNVAWDGSDLWGVTSDGNLFSYDSSGKQLRRLAISMPAGTGDVLDMAWMGDKLVVTYWSPWTLVFNKEFEAITSLFMQCGISSWELGMDSDGKSLWLIDGQSNRIYQCAPVD